MLGRDSKSIEFAGGSCLYGAAVRAILVSRYGRLPVKTLFVSNQLTDRKISFLYVFYFVCFLICRS